MSDVVTRGQSSIDNLPLPVSGHMHESKQAAKTRVEKIAPQPRKASSRSVILRSPIVYFQLSMRNDNAPSAPCPLEPG